MQELPAGSRREAKIKWVLIYVGTTWNKYNIILFVIYILTKRFWKYHHCRNCALVVGSRFNGCLYCNKLYHKIKILLRQLTVRLQYLSLSYGWRPFHILPYYEFKKTIEGCSEYTNLSTIIALANSREISILEATLDSFLKFVVR